MNHEDRDRRLDERLQALLDDRLGASRDAGLRSSTLDPEARRALGAYKAVYRALRQDAPSALPPDFAARVAAAAGFAPEPARRELPPWLFATLVGLAGAALTAASVAAIAEDPRTLLAAFDGPVGPLTVTLVAAALFDQWLAARARRGR